MNIVHVLSLYYKFGGLKLYITKCFDILLKTDRSSKLIYKIFEKADPKDYPRLLKIYYEIYTGLVLNLENPVSFNDKIQWDKLYDRSEMRSILSDKYAVRKWVGETIGTEYLIDLLGAWKDASEIDFDKLPEKFVLKCNHGSGWNIIVDKKNADFNVIRKQLDIWQKLNYSFVTGLELQYNNIDRKIIAEKFIETKTGDLLDYKIHCFKGRPSIIQVIGQRNYETHVGFEAFYDTDWNRIDVENHTYNNFEGDILRPDNLEELIKISKKLCEKFHYVRVDLYDNDNTILFGEMTFTPASGMGKWGFPETIFSKMMS